MKKLAAVLLALTVCLSMAACGKSDPGKQPAAADVVKAVADTLTFQDEMITVDARAVSNLYSIDMDKVEEISMFTSGTRATAGEVTVIRMKDAADIQLAKDAAAERIDDQKIAYESYVPEEMVKIEGAVTYTHGNYLILVMADDTAKVRDTFEAQF